MQKRYLSLWFPRFAVDRVARREPDRATRPFALLLPENGRLTLISASPAAVAEGVRPGMTLADGRSLCPPLQAVDADPAGDRQALARLQRWALRYTPWVAADLTCGPAEAGLVLDITGCAHLLGGEAALLGDLARRLAAFGLTHRTALAGTVGAAWALARHSGSEREIAPPGPLHEALADLPTAGLRLPPADVETLARLGLTRIGSLYGMPRAALTVRFGEAVCRRLDQALGHVAEAISPALQPPPLRVHQSFPEPLVQPEAVALTLDDLLARLGRLLETEGLGARRLTFSLCRADGTEADAAIGVSRPTRDAAHLARLFAPKLETLDPEPGVDLLLLTATATEPFTGLQTGGRLSAKLQGGQNASVAHLVDRLANRLGADNVFRLAPVETPVPEAQCREAPALSEPPPDWSAWPAERRQSTLTPPRRLAAPEPLELALAAETPAEAPPVRFAWRHRLWQVSVPPDTLPARILGAWWEDKLENRAADTPAPPVARDYLPIEATSGAETRRLWLCRDLHTRRWHVHGIFG